MIHIMTRDLYWWDKEEFDRLICLNRKPLPEGGYWITTADVEEALKITREFIFPWDLDRLFSQYQEYKSDPEKYYHRTIKGIPIETWDISQAWDLGRNEAQALQYILRAKYKGQEKEDLEKAIQFLQRAVEEIEEREENSILTN